MKAKSKYSYADALKEYEEWVIDVATKVPRIKCKEQQILMSQYNWETDKIVDAPMTLGDGGDVEEVNDISDFVLREVFLFICMVFTLWLLQHLSINYFKLCLPIKSILLQK